MSLTIPREEVDVVVDPTPEGHDPIPQVMRVELDPYSGRVRLASTNRIPQRPEYLTLGGARELAAALLEVVAAGEGAAAMRGEL